MDMAITAYKMIEDIRGRSRVFLLVCGEAVVYDPARTTVYIPKSNYKTSVLNFMGDFKTSLGHELLWSRHEELDCTSSEMMMQMQEKGFEYNILQTDHKGTVAELVTA